jgi:hypothetical protein
MLKAASFPRKFFYSEYFLRITSKTRLKKRSAALCLHLASFAVGKIFNAHDAKFFSKPNKDSFFVCKTAFGKKPRKTQEQVLFPRFFCPILF